MKKRICLYVLAALLLLGACSAAAPSADGPLSLPVWYLCAGNAPAGDELLRRVEVPLPADGRENIDTALRLFAAAPAEETLVCAVPDGVEILGWSLLNRAVSVTLSDAFAELPAIRQTEAAFALTLTLTAFDEVDAVSVLCGDELLFPGLTAEDALLLDSNANPNIRQLKLYFADGSGTWLTPEYRSVTVADDAELERYILEELLRGPNDSALRSAVPAGTRLLGCSTTEGACTVNLSSEFLSGKPDTALGERLAVYSLVNSLAFLSTVESVTLLVEGVPVGLYLYRDLSEPLSRLDAAVGPPSEAKGQAGVSLFRALPGSGGLTAFPSVVTPAPDESLPQAAVRALTDTAEPGLPVLFSSYESVNSVRSEGRLCFVDVNEAFFSFLPDADTRAVAAEALVATLTALDSVSAVRLTLNGDTAVYEGVDYSAAFPSADY